MLAGLQFHNTEESSEVYPLSTTTFEVPIDDLRHLL